MNTIGPYKLTSTNASGVYPARVRVFRNGTLIVELDPKRSRGLDYIRRYAINNEARQEFIAQLCKAGVPAGDVEMLLTMPEVKK